MTLCCLLYLWAPFVIQSLFIMLFPPKHLHGYTIAYTYPQDGKLSARSEKDPATKTSDCHLQQNGCYQPGSHEEADGLLRLGNLKTVNERSVYCKDYVQSYGQDLVKQIMESKYLSTCNSWKPLSPAGHVGSRAGRSQHNPKKSGCMGNTVWWGPWPSGEACG